METVELEGITCQVVRRDSRRIRIVFHGGRLRVMLPRHIDPLPVIGRHRQWILKKNQWFERQRLLAERLELVCRSGEEFLSLVRELSGRCGERLGVKPSGIGFRKMRSKWGSCSSKGNVSLNTWLQALPDELVAFIVFHELAHLKVRNHGPDFKALIAGEFPDFRELDKKLRLFSLKIL
jgi:predicted metal-dependent hydrolase